MPKKNKFVKLLILYTILDESVKKFHFPVLIFEYDNIDFNCTKQKTASSSSPLNQCGTEKSSSPCRCLSGWQSILIGEWGKERGRQG